MSGWLGRINYKLIRINSMNKITKYKRALFARIINPIKEAIKRPFLAHTAKQFAKKNKVFEFNGKQFKYFCHPYNNTWRNERCVEIPIALAALKEASPERTLELGNVLVHYTPRHHVVVDKYERGDRQVHNVDIMDFETDGKFDLIVCVSTLEHIGWEDGEKDKAKIPETVDRLISLLAPGGHLIATFPIGWNDYLDEHVRKGTLSFSKYGYLSRIGREVSWQEATWDEVKDAKYNHPYNNANGLVVAEYRA